MKQKRDYNLEHRDESSNREYQYDFDKILRKYMLRTYKPFKTGGKALEMGCYKGEFTSLMLSEFDDITVVEASSELIEFTKMRVGDRVRFIHSTFEDLEVKEKFDSIFLMHTVEHLDDPVSVLAKMKSWLNDNGTIYLVAPNANAASRQIAVKMGIIGHNSEVTNAEMVHGHRVTYSLDTLERDARMAGLSVVSRGGIFFKPFANFQFDKLLKTDIIDEAYLDGCYELGMVYPDLCASIYLICKK
ncbi:SAM-dependent methyltransferase [Halobacteriovorax marinus]|uniref:class I SAM-dependent methyltransferase n=1 Tax=Halobacteriovorax marinus TaxID=97084 RepID=UPI000BC313E0|nr:class I SAM-dependent methyltransferase [Halobacteriovorax marinus]ATH06707.1 SAM-dependent methyltransferase [Halobacteriovorax marinus]